MNFVGKFLPDGDASILAEFRGDGVTDMQGRFHPFETDPNTLYVLDATGELSIPETYKIQGPA